MTKYDVRFCVCGSIHFLPWEIIEDATDKNEEIAFICKRCGRGVRIGADDYFDEGKAMYSIDLPSRLSFTVNSFTNNAPLKNYNRVIYDAGVRVPMMTGGFAKFHTGHIWYDTDNPLTSCKIQELGSYDQILNFMKDWEEQSKTVNKNALERELTPEQKEALKGYSYMEAFNWED